MKSLWNSFKIAFAMFSKIPMPQAEWTEENMRYRSSSRPPHVGSKLAGRVLWIWYRLYGNGTDPGSSPCDGRDPCGRASGHFRCLKFLERP